LIFAKIEIFQAILPIKTDNLCTFAELILEKRTPLMENYIVSARKYRPATFESVVGQHALTITLKNAIATGTLAHAYLFCGPRGVGKTLRNQCHFLSAFIEAYLVKNRRTRTTLVTCGPRSKK
jgi:hypothetical protein